MSAFRSATVAAAFLTALASTAFAAGCSSGSSEPDEDATEGELGVESCAAPNVPTGLDGFKKMEACQLQAMFDSDRAKEQTATAPIPVGAYDGIPLCRKEVLRTIKSENIPLNVKKIGGAQLILKLLSLSDTFDNTIAGEIWHGKHFTPNAPNAELGFVNNYIDITDRGIDEDTRRSAEADYFIDRQAGKNWLVLDYKNAATGLRVLKNVSVELIRQVYDTARLVDKERDIWLGMAWMVNTPGQLTADEPNTVIPSCYFALQKRTEPLPGAKGESAAEAQSP